MSNPFSLKPSTPGTGTIHLSLLPPDTPRLRTVDYRYPLKLVTPAPVRTQNEAARLIYTVYLLTYGGGLVAGDSIDLNVVLEATTRLVLLTQGSTKLFKSPSSETVSKQSMKVELSPGSALCYLPDPVQPFEKSCFEQQQIYNIQLNDSTASDAGSLCVLDWVTNGRPANGEDWSFMRYSSRNEIYLCAADGRRRLLLRDNLLLDAEQCEEGLAKCMDGLAVYGTLILHGPIFVTLGKFFLDEFKLLPRIGARKWDSNSDDGKEEPDLRATRRAIRHQMEADFGLLWSAASLRGCVVVKFGAPMLEHARRWLFSILDEEQSINETFGERALLCLR